MLLEQKLSTFQSLIGFSDLTPAIVRPLAGWFKSDLILANNSSLWGRSNDEGKQRVTGSLCHVFITAISEWCNAFPRSCLFHLAPRVRACSSWNQTDADVKLNAGILFIAVVLSHCSLTSKRGPLQTRQSLAALSLELCSPSAFCAPSNDTHPRDVPLQSSAVKNWALTLKAGTGGVAREALS